MSNMIKHNAIITQRDEIIEKMTSGDFNKNLGFAITYAVKAVKENDTDIENYLLLQSIAQSLIALNLQIENFVDHIAEKENWYGHG